METSAETILKKATIHTLNINEGSPLHDAVISAMKEYASHHTAQLESDKAELLEALENYLRLRRLGEDDWKEAIQGFKKLDHEAESLIQKHKK